MKDPTTPQTVRVVRKTFRTEDTIPENERFVFVCVFVFWVFDIV